MKIPSVDEKLSRQEMHNVHPQSFPRVNILAKCALPGGWEKIRQNPKNREDLSFSFFVLRFIPSLLLEKHILTPTRGWAHLAKIFTLDFFKK